MLKFTEGKQKVEEKILRSKEKDKILLKQVMINDIYRYSYQINI